MKNFNILIQLFSVLFLLSCNNEEKVMPQEDQLHIEDASIEIIETIKGNSLNLRTIGSVYDIDNLKKVTYNEDVIYVANNKNNEQKGISFKIENNEIIGSLIVKTIQKSKNIHVMEYYDLSDNLISSVEIDIVNETATINDISNQNGRILDCGQATADCINDSYSNHGWTSVLRIGMSLLSPVFAAVIIADCTATSCL